jgi:dipeptide/tripeptide permease
MDARLTSNFSLLPDQMQTLNAILIMIFIPIFQLIIYPLVEKCGIKTTCVVFSVLH